MNRDVLHGRWVQLTALLTGRWEWLRGDNRGVSVASANFRIGRAQAAYGHAQVAANHKVVQLQRELYREWKI